MTSDWGLVAGDHVSISLLPLEGGAPKGRRLAPQRDERGYEIARSPVSLSKAKPRDLNVVAAFCIGEETQKFFSYRYLTIFALPVCKEDFSLRSK